MGYDLATLSGVWLLPLDFPPFLLPGYHEVSTSTSYCPTSGAQDWSRLSASAARNQSKSFSFKQIFFFSTES